MRIKLLEKMWRHQVPKQLVDEFETALQEYIDSVEEGSDIRQYMFRSYEPIKKAIVDILEFCKSFFDVEEDDYVINEIDDLIQSFQDLEESTSEEDFDSMLGELYDFMDGYSISLGNGQVLIDGAKK
jgi:hypothetical protein